MTANLVFIGLGLPKIFAWSAGRPDEPAWRRF
jgi:hypothetical protein